MEIKIQGDKCLVVYTIEEAKNIGKEAEAAEKKGESVVIVQASVNKIKK